MRAVIIIDIGIPPHKIVPGYHPFVPADSHCDLRSAACDLPVAFISASPHQRAPCCRRRSDPDTHCCSKQRVASSEEQRQNGPETAGGAAAGKKKDGPATSGKKASKARAEIIEVAKK